MTTHLLRVIPHLLAVSAFLLIPPAVDAQAPAAKPPEPLVSLKLDDSVRVVNGRSLKVEQMENGGIRISGSNATDLEGDQGFDFIKRFSVPVPASVIHFDLTGVERAMGVKVTNEAGKTAFTHFRPDRADLLELATIRFEGSREEAPFSGKLSKLSMFIPIPVMSGDFTIEINKIEIVP